MPEASSTPGHLFHESVGFCSGLIKPVDWVYITLKARLQTSVPKTLRESQELLESQPLP